jgi:hypothetical protein
LVVRNPDGTCGCYATESGTVLTLDPDRPGGIIYADGGYPRVIFSTDKSGVFLSHFAFVQESSLTQINFALDKLVQEAASVAKSAAFDEVTHTYAIDTPRTTVSLQLADPNSAFALKMFQIRGLAIRVRCTVPECGTLSDSSKRFFVDKYTIFKKLREKGVPIKVISGDALTADVMNNLIWQPDGTSAEDSRARATAALFAKLLFTDNTTSRTAESP